MGEPARGAVPASDQQLVEADARISRAGQACGNCPVDRPALPIGHAAVEGRRIAGGTGGGQPARQVIGHDDVEQRVGRREQGLGRAEQLAGAVRLAAAGGGLAQPGERQHHACAAAKLLPGA